MSYLNFRSFPSKICGHETSKMGFKGSDEEQYNIATMDGNQSRQEVGNQALRKFEEIFNILLLPLNKLYPCVLRFIFSYLKPDILS